ncbi:MAG TPA: zf-HC2 domain-containing protein, partial [Candidatus Eisenbacteria bacterium]
MTHLNDDQLSALHDGALAPAERAASEAHVADCEACRARLAELASLDEALGSALAHDPGEAYFATFADRV